MTKIKVACPVCREVLTYPHKENEAWGAISLTDFAIVEITAHDGGKLREHMMIHYHDGTWLALYEQRLEYQEKSLTILRARKGRTE